MSAEERLEALETNVHRLAVNVSALAKAVKAMLIAQETAKAETETLLGREDETFEEIRARAAKHRAEMERDL